MKLNANSIILSLLFPNFQKPISSRFLDFFKTINNDNILNEDESIYKIDIEKISDGLDKRTSILIKNIPGFIKKESLSIFLEPVANINFIFMPLKYKNYERTFAYINVTNYKSIIDIIKLFENNNYNVEVQYSPIQGKQELMKYCINKTLA